MFYIVVVPLGMLMLIQLILFEKYERLMKIVSISTNLGSLEDIEPSDKVHAVKDGENAVLRTLRTWTQSKFWTIFFLFWTCVVTVALLLNWYGISEEMVRIRNTVIFICSTMFVIQIIIMLVVQGLSFFRDKMNVLDLVLVLMSIPFIVNYFLGQTGAFWDMMQCIGAFRVIRFWIYLPRLCFEIRPKALAKAFISSVPTCVTMELIHVIFLWGYTIVGCNLFFTPGGEGPYHFDYRPGWNVGYSYTTLIDAFITTFGLSTGSNGLVTLANHVQSNTSIFSRIITVIYTVSLMLFGKYVIMQLYLVLQVAQLKSALQGLSTKNCAFNEYPCSDVRTSVLRVLFGGDYNFEPEANEGDCFENSLGMHNCFLPTVEDEDIPKRVLREKKTNLDRDSRKVPWAVDIWQSQHFEEVVFLLIVMFFVVSCWVSSDDIENDSAVGRAIVSLQLVFVGIFFLEIFIRMYSVRPRRYISDWINRLDIIIFVCCCFGFVWRPAFSFILFRSIRLLRFITSIASCSSLLSGLSLSITTILIAIPFVWLLLLVYVIAGVSLLNGCLFYCEDCFQRHTGAWVCTMAQRPPGMPPFVEATCLGSSPDAVFGTGMRRWSVAVSNFDNPFYAFLSLIRIALDYDWTEVMFDAMCSGHKGEAVGANSDNPNYLLSIFFITFVIVGQYIGTTWFASVVAYVVSRTQLRYQSTKPSPSRSRSGWIYTFTCLGP